MDTTHVKTRANNKKKNIAREEVLSEVLCLQSEGRVPPSPTKINNTGKSIYYPIFSYPIEKNLLQ